MTNPLHYQHPPPQPPPAPVFHGPEAPFSGANGHRHDLEVLPRNPDGSFTCESMRCTWPCKHHVHDTRSMVAMIGMSYDAIVSSAKAGCVPCTLLRGVVDGRCCCTMSGEQKVEGVCHDCLKIEIYYDLADGVVTWARAQWECGVSRFDPVNFSDDASEGRLEFCVPRGQESKFPFPQFFGPVHEDPTSPEAIKLCKSWISDCINTHTECSSTVSAPLPTRVLDVRSESLEGDVKLYCSSGENDKFIALSYCWGGVVPLRTTSETLDVFQQGIPWRDLPRTFQDVVKLARLLDVPFVWIDSLSIIQDQADDWEREAARMASVYGDAYLVVIAAAAPNPNAGFLGPRSRYTWQDVRVSGQNGTVSVREMPYHPPSTDPGSESAVSDRAWCYQERLMSQRRLIYRESEVVWECRHGCRCECTSTENGESYDVLCPRPRYTVRDHTLPKVYRPSNPELTSKTFESSAHAYEFWREAVTAYTERRLTVSSDRLPAISALARAVHEATQDEYLAGLWRGDLLHGLLWEVSPPYGPRCDEYVAPSWSWARQQQKIIYWPLKESDRGVSAVRGTELVDCYGGSVSQNSFGVVRDGHIVLKGHYYDMKLTVDTNPERYERFDGQCVESFASNVSDSTVEQYLCRSRDSQQSQCSGKVRLLWLLPHTCLILAYSQSHPGAFERLGIISENQPWTQSGQDSRVWKLGMAELESRGKSSEYGEIKIV